MRTFFAALLAASRQIQQLARAGGSAAPFSLCRSIPDGSAKRGHHMKRQLQPSCFLRLRHSPHALLTTMPVLTGTGITRTGGSAPSRDTGAKTASPSRGCWGNWGNQTKELNMKNIAIAAFAVFAIAGGGANAADIYHQGGSTKDAPYTPDTRSSNHTGWSARAFIGYAMGERDIESEAKAFENCTIVEKLPTDPLLREAKIKEIEKIVAEGNKDGIFATTSNDGVLSKTIVPIIGAFFNTSDNDDFNSFVFGGGVEHLWHMGQFGMSLGVDVTAYADAESKTEFSKVPTFFAKGTLTNPADNLPGGLDGKTPITVSGYASVDRQIDIDLVGKLYFFPSPDLAFFGKAGPSFAKAKVKGGVFIDGGGADESLEYENDDWSIGYVVGLGVTKWWDPNFSTTLEGDYKAHSFNADGSKSVDLKHGCCVREVGHGNETIDAAAGTDVDDNVWTVKLGGAYHF